MIDELKNHHLLKISAALAYYAIFSFPPLLLVLISLLGIFFGKNAAQGEIFYELKAFTGPVIAKDIQDLIKLITSSGKLYEASYLGSIFFFLGASSVFTEIQESLNLIYSVRPKPKKAWKKLIKNRLLSFLIILIIGLSLILLVLVQVLIQLIGINISLSFPQFSMHFIDFFNFISLAFLAVGLFFLIFKVLPDAVISYKNAFIGALLTSFLFLLGKYAINYFLSYTYWSSLYGAAGYLIILLLWVYYSSIIMFIGAEFTQLYARKTGDPLRPKPYAIAIQNIEIELFK